MDFDQDFQDDLNFLMNFDPNFLMNFDPDPPMGVAVDSPQTGSLRAAFEAKVAELGAQVIYENGSRTEDGNATTDIAAKTIYMAPWTDDNDDQSFWVSMHELGHVATTPPLMMWEITPKIKLHDELQATRWALDNTHEPLTSSGREILATSVTNYVGGYLADIGFDPPAKYGAQVSSLVPDELLPGLVRDLGAAALALRPSGSRADAIADAQAGWPYLWAAFGDVALSA